MANTFRVVTFAAEPNSAGSPYTIYTVPSSTTTVVIGLILTNIHTSQVTTEVELVSTTSGGGRAATNGTSFLVKDAPIPVGSSLELLTGGKVILETGDVENLKYNEIIIGMGAGTISKWMKELKTII